MLNDRFSVPLKWTNPPLWNQTPFSGMWGCYDQPSFFGTSPFSLSSQTWPSSPPGQRTCGFCITWPPPAQRHTQRHMVSPLSSSLYDLCQMTPGWKRPYGSGTASYNPLPQNAGWSCCGWWPRRSVWKCRSAIVWPPDWIRQMVHSIWCMVHVLQDLPAPRLGGREWWGAGV